jgi:hypothetical protein
MKARKRKPAADEADNPIHLFHYYRKLSLDQSKSEAARSYARHHMMDVWSVLPWGLAADILDMKS